MTGLQVVGAGLLTTVQDRGRAGLAHLGVPPSGWVDAAAAVRANRLVGNTDSTAVLETTVGGPTLRLDPDGPALVVAVTGAPAPVTVDGRPAAFDAPVRLRPGSVLSIGAVTHGVRSYLALAGGLQVPPVLGSRSTDLLSGLGPAPLAVGAVIAVGTPVGTPQWAGLTPAAGVVADPVLDLVLGPREDWLTPQSLDALPRQDWTVSPASNRIGLRLTGQPLVRGRTGELPPEGMVTGSVQIPPDGLPIVFLNDHPTTGGYPVIGVLTPQALGLAAQAAPGRSVRFRALSR